MSYTLRPPDHFPSGFIARDFAEPSEIAHLAQVLEELADEWLSISSHMMVEVDNEFGDAVLVRWIGKIEVDFNVRVLAHRIRRWCVRESLGIEISRDAYDVLLLLVPWDDLDPLEPRRIRAGIVAVKDLVCREDIGLPQFFEGLRKALGLSQLLPRQSPVG